MRSIFILLLMPLLSFAQDDLSSRSAGIVEFEYQTVFNMKFDRDRVYRKYRSVLHTAGSNSNFFMIPGVSEISGSDNDMTIDIDTMFRVEKDLDKDALLFSDINLSGRVIYYRDSVHPMQWKLTHDVKWIDSLECHKAETFFRGRQYTAWYCPDIPVPNGPWKLGGLPGLIVEAYENNKDLYFMLSSIRETSGVFIQDSKFHETEELPAYSAFQRYWRDMSNRMQASLSAQDASNCVSCLSKSKVKFYSWEVIPE
jgi:GLPGLI family protein